MKRGSRENEVTHEVRRLHILAILIAFWLIIAPFVLGYGSAVVTVNEIVSAFIISVLGALRLYQSNITWSSWALGGMGLWLILSPFIFGYGHHVSAYWNELGIGILLIILAFSAVGNSIRGHSHLAH
ncbi:MAG TPA: SPW repeat protein [Candidatus Saccharimonadales bacterium]|nr:SPW repeat protein [Candidatus Saccharimonadales bacterium]